MIKSLREHLAKGRFARHVATMMAGNVTAQAIAFMAAPVITRLYSPDEFGLLTLVWSYYGILAVVSCLCYEQPIVIEPRDDNAINIFVLCIIITISLALLIGGIIYLFAEEIALIINFKFDKNYLWFIPVAIFSSGLNKSLVSWNSREKKFKIISLCGIFGTISSVSVKIIFAVLFFSSGAWLLSGNILGFFVPAVILLIVFFYESFPSLRANFSRQKMIRLAKEYYRFPTYHVATSLLNSASQNLPVALLAYYFSPVILGFYGLANSIMKRPVNLISTSMSKVFLQKIAEAHVAGKDLRRHFLLATKGLVLIGIIPFCILGFAGSEIFSFVFGEKWLTAGFYAQLLAPWLFFGFINPPATQVIIVKQKLKYNMFFNVISLSLRTITIIITAIFFSKPAITIACFSAVGVILNLYYISFAYRLLRE